jgi:hypothetical protein
MARIPMPPPTPRFHELSRDLALDDFDAAPPRPFADDEPPNSPFSLSPERATTGGNPSAAPPVDDDALAGAEAGERAPSAPLTPWNNVPRLHDDEPEHEIGLGISAGARDEREDTLVGEVPRNLLEQLSSSGDENTRAYTAPRELIELAKRKREERLLQKSGPPPTATSLAITERPPARRRAEERARQAATDAQAVTPRPAVPESRGGWGGNEDAAPAVARSLAPGEAAAAPDDLIEDPPIEDSAPASPTSSAPESSAPRIQLSPAPFSAESSPPISVVLGEDEPPAASSAAGVSLAELQARPSSKRWWIIAALCILVGVGLSRWQGIVQLFH